MIPDAASAPPASTELLAADIQTFAAEEVVERLRALTRDGNSSDPATQKLVEACCERVRILCREPDQIWRFVKAADVLVGAVHMFLEDRSVQLQALAAIANLCSEEPIEPRSSIVKAGALPSIIASIRARIGDTEVVEMG